MLLSNSSSTQKKGKLGKAKAKAHPPTYHLDLPLEGPVEDTLNSGKQCRELDIPVHLFLFVILIGQTDYGAIEMSAQFCSTGYEFKQQGHKCSMKYGNVIVFCPHTFHRSVICEDTTLERNPAGINIKWLHKEPCTSITCASSLLNKNHQICGTLFCFPPVLTPFSFSPFCITFYMTRVLERCCWWCNHVM